MVPLLSSPKTPAVRPTLMGSVKNVARGIYQATAKFATYASAAPTVATGIGSRYGSNPNSTIASWQRVVLNFTAEQAFKDCAIASAYINLRINYCSSMMRYVPNTGDSGLDKAITEYLHGYDGFGGIFSTMGVDCSMQDAFLRTADLETPMRGDGGMILWRDMSGNLRLIEFSSDQLGEIYNFTMERYCRLERDKDGNLFETYGGANDVLYQSGRYFRGPDCVAYKIYQRTNAFYANPVIYDACDVFYFRDPTSIRGVRGVSKFATALLHMEKGERLFQIGMDAAMRQAKTAMVVMNQNGQPNNGGYETDINLNGVVTYAERIPDGPLVEYFYNGDSANFTSPDSPGPELIQGVETSDERCALALGLPYAMLVSPKQVGGAPSRLEMNKASKEFSRIQNLIHRPKLRRISDVIILDAMRRGLLPIVPNICRGRWQLPISPVVDAGYSNDENIDNLRAGIECPQDIVAETNRDWKQIVEAKGQAAVDVAMQVEDRNRELVAAGYKPTITALDIAQLSDNPQQAAAAENLTQGKSATGDNGNKQEQAKLSNFDETKHPRGQPDNKGEFGPGGGSASKSPYSSSVNDRKIDSSISSVKEGRGSIPLFHGTRMEDVSIHPGKTFADNKQTADNYADEKTLSGNVDVTGLKIAKVKSFDRDDANYGAIGDSDDDIAALQKRGIDLIEYEDEDPSQKQHTAYRVVSKKAVERIKESVKLNDNRLDKLAKIGSSEWDGFPSSKEETRKLLGDTVQSAWDHSVKNFDGDKETAAEFFKEAGINPPK